MLRARAFTTGVMGSIGARCRKLESPEGHSTTPEGGNCVQLAGRRKSVRTVDKTGEDNEDTVSGDGWLFHGGICSLIRGTRADVVHRFENVYELAFYEDAINELERVQRMRGLPIGHGDSNDETISEESVRVLFLINARARCMMEPRPTLISPMGLSVGVQRHTRIPTGCSYCE